MTDENKKPIEHSKFCPVRMIATATAGTVVAAAIVPGLQPICRCPGSKYGPRVKQ